MAKHDNRIPIQTALGYVEEARAASRDWRAKSWRDHEMYDGDQWTPEDRQRAVDAGIDPLTINRIFPAINPHPRVAGAEPGEHHRQGPYRQGRADRGDHDRGAGLRA